MIEGAVNSAYEAIVTLALQGPDGQSREINAVLDTGHNGALTLPPSVVADLGLPFRGQIEAILADGSEATLDIYDVAVVWDGRLRNARDSVSDAVPLLGMRLLARHSLHVDVLAGGRVAIQAIE